MSSKKRGRDELGSTMQNLSLNPADSSKGSPRRVVRTKPRRPKDGNVPKPTNNQNVNQSPSPSRGSSRPRGRSYSRRAAVRKNQRASVPQNNMSNSVAPGRTPGPLTASASPSSNRSRSTDSSQQRATPRSRAPKFSALESKNSPVSTSDKPSDKDPSPGAEEPWALSQHFRNPPGSTQHSENAGAHSQKSSQSSQESNVPPQRPIDQVGPASRDPGFPPEQPGFPPQHPVRQSQHPTIQHNFPQYQQPGRQFQQPGRQFQQPGRDFQQPGRQFQQPGRQFQQPGRQFQQQGRQFQQPGRQFQQPGRQQFEQPSRQIQQQGRQFQQTGSPAQNTGPPPRRMTPRSSFSGSAPGSRSSTPGPDFDTQSVTSSRSSTRNSSTRNSSHNRFYMPLPKQRFCWMTHKEIEMILRKQLYHSQSQDPMADDFYAQVWNARQGGEWKGVGIPQFGSVKVQDMSTYRNPDGSPKLPDGTLGKISGPTMRRPRTLVSLSGPSGGEATEGNESKDGKEPEPPEDVPVQYKFSNRALAYLIEEGFRHLVNVENIDSNMHSLQLQISESQLEDNSDILDLLKTQKISLVGVLLQSLDVGSFKLPGDNPRAEIPDHLLFKLAPISKGRLLFFRSSLILQSKPQSCFQLLLILCSKVHLFALPEEIREFDEKLGSSLAKPIYAYSFPQVLVLFHTFTAGLTYSNCVPIVSSKVGSGLLKAFLKRGDSSTFPENVNQQHVLTWRGIFNVIITLLQNKLGVLISTSDETPSPPASLPSSPKLEEIKQTPTEDVPDPPKTPPSTASTSPKPEPEQPPKSFSIIAEKSDLWELCADLTSHALPDNRRVIAADQIFCNHIESDAANYSPAEFLRTCLAESVSIPENRPPNLGLGPGPPTSTGPPTGPPPLIDAPPSPNNSYPVDLPPGIGVPPGPPGTLPNGMLSERPLAFDGSLDEKQAEYLRNDFDISPITSLFPDDEFPLDILQMEAEARGFADRPPESSFPEQAFSVNPELPPTVDPRDPNFSGYFPEPRRRSPESTRSPFTDYVPGNFPEHIPGGFPESTRIQFPESTRSKFPESTRSQFPESTHSEFPQPSRSQHPEARQSDNFPESSDRQFPVSPGGQFPFYATGQFPEFTLSDTLPENPLGGEVYEPSRSRSDRLPSEADGFLPTPTSRRSAPIGPASRTAPPRPEELPGLLEMLHRPKGSDEESAERSVFDVPPGFS
eukprot:959398_1